MTTFFKKNPFCLLKACSCEISYFQQLTSWKAPCYIFSTVCNEERLIT